MSSAPWPVSPLSVERRHRGGVRGPPAARRACPARGARPCSARLPAWYVASASGESTSPRVGCFGATSSMPGRLDAEPLAEDREDRPGLHLADAGQRRAAAPRGPCRPSPRARSRRRRRRIARRSRRTAPGPCRPSSPGSDGAPVARGRRDRARPGRSRRSRGVEVPEPALEVPRPENAFWTVTCWSSAKPMSRASGSVDDQPVGVVVAGERKLVGAVIAASYPPGRRPRSRHGPRDEINRDCHSATAYSIEIRTPSFPSSMSRIGPVMPASIASRMRSEVASESPGTRSRAARPSDNGTRRMTGRPVSRTWMRRLVAGRGLGRSEGGPGHRGAGRGSVVTWEPLEARRAAHRAGARLPRGRSAAPLPRARGSGEPPGSSAICGLTRSGGSPFGHRVLPGGSPPRRRRSRRVRANEGSPSGLRPRTGLDRAHRVVGGGRVRRIKPASTDCGVDPSGGVHALVVAGRRSPSGRRVQGRAMPADVQTSRPFPRGWWGRAGRAGRRCVDLRAGPCGSRPGSRGRHAGRPTSSGT